VHELLIQQLKPTSVTVVQQVEEAELDEMWSFVGSKKYQRWLWHAIDHQTGQILAYGQCFPQIRVLSLNSSITS
jgi:IS1 transposase